MLTSHYRAGSGAVLIETREEARFLREALAELPRNADIAKVSAPSGQLLNARDGKEIKAPAGLIAAYQWAFAGPGRVLIVYDFHVLINAPGHWRALIEALPRLRSPQRCNPERGDFASLVVFLAPAWELESKNPLRGSLPVIPFALPSRESLRTVAAALRDLPAGTEGEAVVDALCGLSADSAEQAAAEQLARPGARGWDPKELQDTRKTLLADGGLEIWEPVTELGGLSGLRQYIETRVTPWLRDDQLSTRRLLMCGVPGVGKSYCARWLAAQLGAPCARLSIPRLKGGIVGQSEGNLRRALGTLDALGAHAPLVAVIEEIDTIAREGLDGGTSSGMFSELLTWLQESKSQTVVIATLNHLSKLDAALESRFRGRFFFDLPTRTERAAVAEIHYRRLRCERPADAAQWTADVTEGFSSREIAESLVMDVAQVTARKPTKAAIAQLAGEITPTSQTKADDLAQMRRAASTLRRANDPKETDDAPRGRRVATSAN